MSYSTLPAPSDLFGVNSALRSRAFPLATDHRRDSGDSHSPMSEPRSPLFRPSLPAEISPHLASLYSSPYAAAAVAAAVAGQGAGVTTTPPFGAYSRPGAASFYPSMIAGEAWRRSPYMSQLDLWPHLRSLEAVVGPRTKAPREATSILKSWLNEHKDNPYPTKSEKMTLSLVTHMTLTQVSTWFANARRRIKKENKMTWTPKTRCGERDGSSSNEEESEKDYYGRLRSPFALPDQGESGIRLPSAEFDESKRTPNFEQPSSRVFQPDSTRKSAHPFFAAFAGFHTKYGNQGGALQEMIKHGMTGGQSQEFSKPTSEVTKSDSKSPISTEGEKRENPSPSKFPHLSKEQFPVISSADQRLDFRFDQKTPFVKLNPDYNTEDCEAQNSSDEHEVDCEEVAPSTSDANGKKEESSKDVMSNDGGGPATPNLEDSSNSTTGPGFFRPPFMPGDMTSNSAASVDALSTWFRDFQRLVSSGKEFEAKQALATALAVAAKAGAYSGLNGPAPFQTLMPQGGEASYPAEASEVGSMKTPSPNRGFRFSPLNSTRSHRTSSSDDITALSPESNHRQSTSPGAQYSRPTHRLPSDESPMNLTKPPTKVWTQEKIAGDGPIEA